jgi:transcriptional regulator with XRE-family HTH domain
MLNQAAVALRRAIERKGLTHEDVERELGLAPRSGQVTRLLSGERKPGRELAFRIQQLFKVPMAWWEILVSSGKAA